MKRMIDSILQGYGSLVTITRTDGRTAGVRAFVQPVTDKSWQNLQKTMHALGEGPVGRFVYIGPADAPLDETDTLVCGGRKFLVRRAETLELAGQALYIWGLLVPDGGDDPWNS